MDFEKTNIQELMRLAALKYLENAPGLEKLAVNDLIVKALRKYLNA